MAPHSSTLAWKIPWTEEPGRLQSMLRVRYDWATSLSLFIFMHWRRKWQPTPVFLPGESQGRGSLVGCRLLGCRVGHNWSDLAAAAAANSLLTQLLLREVLLQQLNLVLVILVIYTAVRNFFSLFTSPQQWTLREITFYSRGKCYLKILDLLSFGFWRKGRNRCYMLVSYFQE